MSFSASLPRGGQKRPHSDSPASQPPYKKRRIRHSLRHVQYVPAHTEPASQDPVFIQGQLLRSIAAELVRAGFDSVKPSALEMFRGQVEEYMLHFLATARSSMNASRRTRPLPNDFSLALALQPNTNTASLLRPLLDLSAPEIVSCPLIRTPDLPPAQAPDLSKLLQPLTSQSKPQYVPAHFPQIPSRHTWQATPVYAERERDARKMREKATEEGVLAEQALRKLAAAKCGTAKTERWRPTTQLSEIGVKRNSGKRGGRTIDDLLGDVLKEVVGMEEDMDSSGTMDAMSNPKADGMDLGAPDGVVVNHEIGHWRKGIEGRATVV